MGYAVIIGLILSAVAMGFVGFSLLKLRANVQTWVTESIDDAVRKQDDRIRQQVLRQQAKASEEGSDEETNHFQRIGQPFNG